jgi:hypothetical protein
MSSVVSVSGLAAEAAPGANSRVAHDCRREEAPG